MTRPNLYIEPSVSFLEQWTGPVEIRVGDAWVPAVRFGRAYLSMHRGIWKIPKPGGRVRACLSRAEVRARAIVEIVGWDRASTGISFRPDDAMSGTYGDDMTRRWEAECCVRLTSVGSPAVDAWAPIDMDTSEHGDSAVGVPALAELDPHDHTRIRDVFPESSDESYLVDALALKAIWEHVYEDEAEVEEGPALAPCLVDDRTCAAMDLVSCAEPDPSRASRIGLAGADPVGFMMDYMDLFRESLARTMVDDLWGQVVGPAPESDAAARPKSEAQKRLDERAAANPTPFALHYAECAAAPETCGVWIQG